MSSSSGHSPSSLSSSSPSSSSSPPIKSQFSSNPAESLKFGEKFKPGPIKVIHPPRRETESGLSSIDSRPSIRQKPKNSEFHLDLPKKPQSGQVQVKKLPSMKYTKNENLSSESLSSDSFSSSISKQSSPLRDPPKKILEAKPIEMNPEPEGPKVFKPVLNFVDLDDSPNILIKPSEQPIKPSVPHLPSSNREKVKGKRDSNEVNKHIDVNPNPEIFKFSKQSTNSIESPRHMIKPSEKPVKTTVPPLPINKIEGIKVVKNPKEVKNYEVDSSDVDKLDSSSEKSSESSKKIVKFKGTGHHQVSKPSKSSSSSSESSNPDASSDQINIDLYKPLPQIAIKIDEKEINRSNNERNNIKVDADENNLREINLGAPPNKDQFLFSANYLSFNQLLKNLEEFSFVEGDFWETKSCFLKLCSCFIKTPDLSPIQRMNLAKLDNLSKITYNNDSEFHRNILFSYYCRMTNRASFQMDNQTLSLLGLSSFDYKHNELSKKFSLIIIFHQLFLVERKPIHLRKFNEAKKSDRITSFKILGILMEESFRLLKLRKLNCLFNETSDVISLFFEFHTGLIRLWSDLSGSIEEFTASIREAVDRAAKNPALCLEIFKSG